MITNRNIYIYLPSREAVKDLAHKHISVQAEGDIYFAVDLPNYQKVTNRVAERVV